jgi:uncharacterized membrane protein
LPPVQNRSWSLPDDTAVAHLPRGKKKVLMLHRRPGPASRSGEQMESNQRYYARRAMEEAQAAARAVTPEARARRQALAESFARQARELSTAGQAQYAA